MTLGQMTAGKKARSVRWRTGHYQFRVLEAIGEPGVLRTYANYIPAPPVKKRGPLVLPRNA